MPQDFSQEIELASVEEMARTIAKRTRTRCVVDNSKRAAFANFSNVVAAYSCEGTLGIWSDVTHRHAVVARIPSADAEVGLLGHQRSSGDDDSDAG